MSTALVFELPALMIGAVWLSIASRDRLASWRKYAVLLAFTAAAIVTPTSDALSQTVVASFFYLMYEIGLLLAYLFRAEDDARRRADARRALRGLRPPRLAPTLRPGRIVVADNLRARHSERARAAVHGPTVSGAPW